MLRGTWGDPENARVKEVYFSTFPGYYFTGDGCRKDEDGYYWLMGRVDDVINISGHRLGTAEVESALVSHAAVAEAAVVGFPHDIKGEGIYAYVILKAGAESTDGPDEDPRRSRAHGDRPDRDARTTSSFVPDLPKTRSGKIMRRILRKVAAGERDMETFGDITTLADPSIVEMIVEGAPDVE